MRFLNQIAEALGQIAKTLDQIADMHKAMQESLLTLRGRSTRAGGSARPGEGSDRSNGRGVTLTLWIWTCTCVHASV
jgi:hypothetical protein